MNKMEIELTDEQLEKVNKLESHDISVGEAIDMLFEVRDRASTIIEEIDEIEGNKTEINTEEKDSGQEDSGKSYDEAIQDRKHHVSWAKDFFKL